MSCAPINPTDICPTVDQVRDHLVALLPRGRAWRSIAGVAPGSTLESFWRAVARPIQALEQRLCDLRNEMICQTIVETLPEWLREYGLPDACDPYPNLCAKVAALGGSTAAYYRGVASALGWSIGIGFTAPATMNINITLALSPAYQGGSPDLGRVAGCYQAGATVTCGPNVSALDCVMQRIAPAHATLVYTYT